MPMIQEAFAKENVASSHAEVTRQLSRLPRPGVNDPKLTADRLTAELDIGWRAWVRARPEEVVAQLPSWIRVAEENLGLVVSSEKVRTALFRGRVALMLAQLRLGNAAEAKDVMEELVRSSPGPLDIKDYGSQAEKLLLDVSTTVARMTRGKLLVAVTQPDAQIFVNEYGVARGGSYTGNMLPGSYRVVVQVNDLTRRYDVTVSAGAETHLEIDWGLDSQLVVSDRWIGIVARDLTPARERELMTSFARRSSVDIVFVRLHRSGAAMALRGHWYRRSTAKQERGGEIRLGGDDERKAAALASYLARDLGSPDVVPIGGTTLPIQQADRSSARPLAWGLVSGGLALIATGAVLFAVDEDDTGAFTYTDTARLAIAVGAAGLVATSLGGYLFLRKRGASESGPTALVGPGAAMIGWVGRF
ncbi:MAG: hypothetical protein WKG01_15170 [Kofleriaceae bacterium]